VDYIHSKGSNRKSRNLSEKNKKHLKKEAKRASNKSGAGEDTSHDEIVKDPDRPSVASDRKGRIRKEKSQDKKKRGVRAVSSPPIWAGP